MCRATRSFEHPVLHNPVEEVRRALLSLELERDVRPRQTVAVGCSSRGISNYAAIVTTTVSVLKELGLRPFLVPAMGSHAGGTAMGQARALGHQGISEETAGAPILSSPQTTRIGATADGVSVYLDRHASQADHIVVINRVKKHTEFESDVFESGIQKMLAIGLGKQRGASAYHGAMFSLGYERVIASVAQVVLDRAPILAAVGVVENGYGQTAHIAATRPSGIALMEAELLALAKSLAAGLPFADADVVVLDEIGKDISGTGFDTKVLGRIGLPLLSAEPTNPEVKRIVACDLTAASDGNAIGIGLADFVTQRLVDKIDWPALAMNALTGGAPEMARIPLTLPNDREAIVAAAKCVGQIPAERLRLIRVKNTSSLVEFEISEAYAVGGHLPDDLALLGAPRPMAFDERGDLLPIPAGR